MSEEQLKEAFQSCCEHYFKNKFQENKFLYFEKIPHRYFGTAYRVDITRIKYEWQGTPEFTYDIYKGQGPDYGKRKCQFKQNCFISYFFKINNSLEIGRETKTINFYSESLEPYGATISPTIIVDDLIVFDKFRKIKQDLKKHFKIENIDELPYRNDSIGFGFFADVLRKERIAVSQNSEISHAYFYYEIAHCHGEVEVCLVTALFHQKYSSDLLGRKVINDGKEFFLPNLSYNDLQYLTMIGFGLERLYSFWDRIAYLLYNYESLGFRNSRDVSFDKYFGKLEKHINSGNSLVFDKKSTNLNWFINFHKTKFCKITDYRHRIVHYQMTSNWDGVLSSKFTNNVFENTVDPNELNKVKLEFEGLGFLLYEQFNFCKDGFITAMNLIDELN